MIQKVLGFGRALGRHKGPLLMVALCLVMVFFPDTAFAETVDVKDTTEQSLAFMIAMFVKMLNSVLWLILPMIGELMSNDMIISPGMEIRLLGIWAQIRNIVNIAFVIVLLAIAFYNVTGLGGGEGNLALKTALPKVVVGLILVNFTFLGGKIVIDLSSVATTAVFSLPELVDDYKFDEQQEEFEEKICSTEDGGKYTKADHGDDIPLGTQMFCAFNDDTQEYTGELDPLMEVTYFQELNVSNIGLIMAVNMGSLESIALLNPDAIKGFDDLVINGLFSLIMYIVFMVSYLVLALVLLARVVVLWVALALSPLAVLVWVVPQIKDALGSGGDIVNKITKHLLAPIIIGLVFTIGYMMVEAFAGMGTSFTNFASSQDELFADTFLVGGIENMEKLMIAAVTIVIMWAGVFAAAEGTIAQTVTDTIKGAGEGAAKWLAKSPSYLPILPFKLNDGSNEQVRPADIMNLAGAVGSSFRRGDLFGHDSDDVVERLAKDAGINLGNNRLERDARKARNGELTHSQAQNRFGEHLNEQRGLTHQNYKEIKALAEAAIKGNDRISEGKRTQYLKAIKDAKSHTALDTTLRELARDDGGSTDFNTAFGMNGDAMIRALSGNGSVPGGQPSVNANLGPEPEEPTPPDTGTGDGPPGDGPPAGEPPPEEPPAEETAEGGE